MLKKNDKLVAPSEIINALHVLYNEGKDKELLFRLNKLKEIYPHTPEIYNIMGAIAVKKVMNLKPFQTLIKQLT